MVYPNDFINLVETTKEDLIGWGNPVAKILIIGCEPATPIDLFDNIKREITHNRDQWLANLHNSSNLEKWVENKDPMINPCKTLEFGYDNFNPRHPYCRQINSFFHLRGGTSRTWWNYQKLVDNLRGTTTHHRDLNFFNHAFVTDLSDVNAPKSIEVKFEEKEKAIRRRKEVLFTHPFFHNFPIIIVACGHYVKQFDIKLNELFKIPYIKMEYDKNDVWINLHKSIDNKVLLHTQHLTARGLKINDYIDKIVELCQIKR